jgi:hypothetical protein
MALTIVDDDIRHAEQAKYKQASCKGKLLKPGSKVVLEVVSSE